MSGWQSFVAIGDSFTEGVGDPAGPGRWRGWADRVAERLARDTTDLRYANLAVRGLRLAQIVERQVPVAEELRPDLVSLCAAGNDFLRPRVDPDGLAAEADDAVARLRATGADVLLFTSFDPRNMRVMHRRRGSVAVYNQHLHAIAQRHGARVVDMWAMTVLRDPRARVDDRLHLSPEAHRRVALRVCEALGLDVDEDWRDPWPSERRAPWHHRRRDDAVFVRRHLVPWTSQRLRGRPEGYGRFPKRPELALVAAPGPPTALDPDDVPVSGGRQT